MYFPEQEEADDREETPDVLHRPRHPLHAPSKFGERKEGGGTVLFRSERDAGQCRYGVPLRIPGHVWGVQCHLLAVLDHVVNTTNIIKELFTVHAYIGLFTVCRILYSVFMSTLCRILYSVFKSTLLRTGH